jgi:spore coat protein A
MRFTGYTGRYVFHCHNLAHENHSMMGQMRVVDG